MLATTNDMIEEALKAAYIEGFKNANTWEETELLSWYKSLLKFEGKRIPKLLRKYKDTLCK